MTSELGIMLEAPAGARRRVRLGVEYPYLYIQYVAEDKVALIELCFDSLLLLSLPRPSSHLRGRTRPLASSAEDCGGLFHRRAPRLRSALPAHPPDVSSTIPGR